MERRNGRRRRYTLFKKRLWCNIRRYPAGEEAAETAAAAESQDARPAQQVLHDSSPARTLYVDRSAVRTSRG